MKPISVALLVAAGVAATVAGYYIIDSIQTRSRPEKRLYSDDAMRDMVIRTDIAPIDQRRETPASGNAQSEYSMWVASLSDADRATERGLTSDIRSWLAGMDARDRMSYMARVRPSRDLQNVSREVAFT